MYRANIHHLEKKAQMNNGLINPNEQLQLNYFANPYLLLLPDESILDRLGEIMSNSVLINEKCKLSMTPLFSNNGKLLKIFSDTFIEAQSRGLLTDSFKQQTGMLQLNSYFQDGLPNGFKMFENYEHNFNDNVLFRFSEKKYIHQMYKEGYFRICPAAEYENDTHLKAIKDNELVREYYLSAVNDILQGEKYVERNGVKMHFTNGTLPLSCHMNNYYTFCTSNKINRRMPTDFHADSVLIIKDKKEFLDRCKNRLASILPDWEFLESDVTYYDPYTDILSDFNQEFYKHFSFAYQDEHRFILRNRKLPDDTKLENIFLDIGSLEDISEVIDL